MAGMNRLIFALGLGSGFLLGARAGRARYEQIQRGARSLAASAPVQSGLAQAQRTLDAAAPRAQAGARRLATETGEFSRAAVGTAGDGAKALASAVGTGVGAVRTRLTSGAGELQERVTLTAEDLRRRSDELRQRSEEQIDGLRALGEEQIDQVRRRVDEQLERSREQSADGFVRAGAARDEALDVWDDEDDESAPGGAPRD